MLARMGLLARLAHKVRQGLEAPTAASDQPDRWDFQVCQECLWFPCLGLRGHLALPASLAPTARMDRQGQRVQKATLGTPVLPGLRAK
jgi:hypothetical protein